MRIWERGEENERSLLFFPCTAEPVWAFEGTLRLLDVMERTMAGESVYPDATPELQLGLASSYKFTDRELEVLREMTGGDTNQEIAERLHMSVATVKTHILNMLEKPASEIVPSWPCGRGKSDW